MSFTSNLSQNSIASNHRTFPDEKSASNALQSAKKLLMQCGASGDSLFNHLSSIISKVIDEEPGASVVDNFEQFSERVRHESFRMDENLLEEGYKELERLALAQKILPQLVKILTAPIEIKEHAEVNGKSLEAELDIEEEEEEILNEAIMPKDLLELQSYWNLLGIGFPQEEVFMLKQSMSRIEQNPSYLSCRFWGKIFGLNSDYYIVECALTIDAVEDRIDEIETIISSRSLEPIALMNGETANVEMVSKKSTQILDQINDSNFNVSDFQSETENYPTNWNFSMKIAESQFRSPVEIPPEVPGCGVNRCVYYASTDLTSDWIELPSVTPHQINVSRRIKKYLTGDLNGNLSTYPEFPGTEQNYLRALIARISAGTNIAPRNFYTSDGYGSDEESDDGIEDEVSMKTDKPIKQNSSYRPLPIANLLKLDYWEHVKPEILKQGRVTYFDGNKLRTFVADDEDDERSDISSEKSDLHSTRGEVPVPLFASCSGDRLITEEMKPWSIQISDVDEKLVLVQSRVWPGAYSFVKEKTCDHIYIGYGHKYWPRNYAPSMIPQLPSEFLSGSDVIECNDPSVEEEIIFKKKEDDDELSDVEIDEVSQ